MPRTKKITEPKIDKPESRIIGQSKIKKFLNVAAANNLAALVVGETGVGKTSIIQDLADQLGHEWVRFNLTGETTVDEFVGKYILLKGETVWQDGILIQAMKAGKWLIVDEINVALPEILFALHSLLDDDKFVVMASHEGEVVRPHDDFRFFGTMNPTEEYAGTKELNKAFKSRFPMIIHVGFPSKKQEADILVYHTNIDRMLAIKMVDVGRKLRTAKDAGKIFYTCSTRDLIQWARLFPELGMEDSFTVSVLNKAHGEKDRVGKLFDEVMIGYSTLAKAVDEDGGAMTLEWFEGVYKKAKENEAGQQKAAQKAAELMQPTQGITLREIDEAANSSKIPNPF